jgi:hypothetical protein
MTGAFAFGSGLGRTLPLDPSRTQSDWRAHVRHLFSEVDGSELMRSTQNPRSNLYAALVKKQIFSMYEIALHPDANAGF